VKKDKNRFIIDGKNSLLIKTKKHFEYKFKNCSTTSQLKKQFQNITQFLDTISDEERNLNFMFTRFLCFVRPDQFHFSYDSDVKNLSIEEVYHHCKESIQFGDPCAQALCLLAKYKSHTLAKKLPQAYTQQVNILQCVDLDRLSTLTMPQREYLINIHQSEILQNALRQIFTEWTKKSVLHGDYRMPNILFRDDQKIPLHVIDWELCGRGPRMYDWATLMVDYVTLYLCHYMETRGHPEKLSLTDIEKLLQQHFQLLQGCFPQERPQALAQEYLQWIGALLMLKGLYVIPQYSAGEILSELLFQMGRRFLVEHDQLQKKYFSL